MFATTLRLELAKPLENASYGVFGNAPNLRADGVVIENLAIDCDMQNQRPTPPYNYPRLMVLGIGLLGNDIRIKRVRVINAGTRTPGFDYGYKVPDNGGNDNGAECFPLFLTTHDPNEGDAARGFATLDQRNSFIEDCIVERPFHSNGRETTCLHMGGGGYNEHCGIRNCVVDCAQTNGDCAPEVPVTSLVFEALQARLDGLGDFCLVLLEEEEKDLKDVKDCRGGAQRTQRGVATTKGKSSGRVGKLVDLACGKLRSTAACGWI